MLPDLSELSSAPIYTLEPGPFSVLVDELAKRLAPDSATIAVRSAETLCAQVHQACRELATLGKLPGQSIDTKYNCYKDPDGDVWKAAHVIFGVDPTRFEIWDRMGHTTWRNNFRYLCKAFDPDYQLEFYLQSRGDAPHFVEPLWLHLWEAVPENRRVAKEWQAVRASNDAHYAPMRSYPLSHEEILQLQTRLRDRHYLNRDKLAENLRSGMNRLHIYQGAQLDYVGIWPRRHHLFHPSRGASHMPVTALYYLLGTIIRQNVQG